MWIKSSDFYIAGYSATESWLLIHSWLCAKTEYPDGHRVIAAGE
jgi:hypothetical protein